MLAFATTIALAALFVDYADRPPLARLFSTVVLWGSISLFVLAVYCITSWRVKEWMARAHLSISMLGFLSAAVTLLIATAVELTGAAANPALAAVIVLVLCAGLARRLLLEESTPVGDFSKTPVSDSAGSAKNRVIVLIFDELDQFELTQSRSAEGLPVLDAFLSRSVFLMNAVPPHRCTEVSIPALLSGKMIDDARPIARNELSIRLHDHVGEPMRMSQMETLLHDTKRRGLTVGANVGYHPIEELYPGLCDVASSQEVASTELGVNGRSLVENVWLQVRAIFETPAFSVFEDTLYARHSVERYERALVFAKGLLSDRHIDLCFVHLPVPHPPFIYDTAAHRVSPLGTRRRSYRDNLHLADRTLAELLAVLDTSRPTTVILTSDHWWRHGRTKDLRVPFAVWRSDCPDTGIPYERPCNTLFLRSLVSDLFDGKLESRAAVISWLDVNAVDLRPCRQ
jgi:hypothetical protein